MNTAMKSLVVVTGLLGAGVLLTYGLHHSGGGFYGHHATGFHRPGMGYGAAMWSPAHIEARLATVKQDLAITPDQEGPWNAFASQLTAHAQKSRTLHEKTRLGGFSQTFSDHTSAMASHWEQRAAVHQAAQDLISVLNDSQRSKIDQPFDFYLRGAY